MSLETSKVSYLTITAMAGAGQRIDNYLVKKLNNVPKSKIYNILRTGEVRVNKGRIKPSYKLQEDDLVRIPPLTNSATKAPVIPQPAIERINIEQYVIYEDANLLVVNKPGGLAVHGGSGLSFGLVELLRAMRPHLETLELVHRIDRDTSGCVMVAKNLPMLRGMHELFRNKTIQKTYHLLSKGYAPEQFVVQEPLKKHVLSSGERIVTVHPEGNPSLTRFKVLGRFGGATMLEAQPITGRTHQIRVHAAVRNLPIIGDQKYGDKAYNKMMAQSGLQRLFLHAYELRFACPLTGKLLTIRAEHDEAWTQGLEAISQG